MNKCALFGADISRQKGPLFQKREALKISDGEGVN
jgi:hypothetical protein